MKIAMIWLGLAVAGWLAAGTAWAGKTPKAVDTVSGGVTWSYTVVDETASVMSAKPAVGVLSIPAELDGYPVTGVGYKAFGGCDELTGVVIPAGVTSIGERAFQYCTTLEEVTIPTGVTNIGTMAFQYCESLKTVALPQSLEGIGTNAFYRCDALEKLYAPALWVETSKVSAAGVGSGCTVVYGEVGVETLVFDPNGGSCDTLLRSYPLGVAYGWLPEATATGNRRFAGWWTEASGGTQVTETDEAETEGARRLYAHWTLLTQTVHFSVNGGSCDTESATYAIGETYSPLPTPTREHYAFAGWWTGSNWGEQVTESTEVSASSERWLYAHWTLAEQEVIFNANGGSCDTTNGWFAIGGTYKPLPKATREHYDFDGWFTESNGGDRLSGLSVVTTNAARTLYAHWTLAEQVVTFDANGGVCETTNKVYTIGDTYKPLPTPTREHYQFAGWFTTADGNERVSGASMVTAEETRTLYAHWTAAEQVVTFVNTYGEIGETLSYTYSVGEPYGSLPDVTRDGCFFGGWRTENGEDVAETSVVSTNEALTLYAGWWCPTVSDGAVTVTFLGPVSCHLVIPGELGGFPVTGIECNAFSSCSHLRSVTIPDSLTSVGEYAFGGCSGLTAVYIHGLTTWCGITFGDETANPLYYAHHIYLDGEELVGDLVIPADVTNIGNYAFYGHSGLTSVTIPVGVTNIGYSAFSGCCGLTSVTIPGNVTAIGRGAFSGCCGLTSVRIPDGVTNIEGSTFSDCSNLTSVTIGNGVRDIGYSAFRGCSCLTSVTIPDNVTGIGAYAFSECSGLTNLAIPESVTGIGSNAFSYCRNLAKISIGGNITNDYPSEYHDSYYSNGYWTYPSPFANCSNLVDVTLGGKLQHVPDCFLAGLSNLTSVTIGDSVTSIGEYAFLGCSGLRAVYIHDLAAWCGISFEYGDANPLTYAHHLYLDGKELLGDVGIPDGVTRIGSYAFSGCSGLTSVTIPDDVTSIGYSSFSGCNGLRSVTISGSVTSIESTSFYLCSNLTSVTIGNGVTAIAHSAFSGCSGLTGVMIPNSVTSIGDGAFSDCSGLTSVTIGNGVTAIAHSAFSGCSGLTGVMIPNSVTSIGDGAFSDCSGLTSVTIPDSVTSIGYSAFSGCGALTSVTIPNSVKNSGGSVFRGCSNLTSVTIGNGVTNIGWNAFSGCSGLTSVTIPDGVTNIEAYAFSSCTGLTSVTIGNGMTSIGYGAFSGCRGLTSVTIPDSVTNIGENVFTGCGGLKTLYVPPAWRSLHYPVEHYTDWGDLDWTESVFWRVYAAVPYDCTVVYGSPTSQETRFDANGGRCAVVSRMHAVGEAYGELPEATRERYAFGGWWTERVGGKHVTGESVVSVNSSLRLYAHWSLSDDGYAAWLAEQGEMESALPVEGDADGDGMTNWDEYVAGTDPRNGQERLEARIQWEAGKLKVETSVAVPRGRKVRVEGRKSLVGDEEWTDVTGKEASWEREGWRFFRVEVELDGAQ